LAKGRWGSKNIKRPPVTDGLLQLVVVYKIIRQQVISICCMGKIFFLAYNPFIFTKNYEEGIVAIMGKKTLVLGASSHSDRYSNMAIFKLKAHGHEVFALGAKASNAGDVPIVSTPENWGRIDTVALYLNPYNQQRYYRYLVDLKPDRVIFNPGTENHELELLLEENGIKTMEACTLVMLSVGTF
jgi:hypothetical protein